MSDPDDRSYTIKQFCEAENISYPTYKKLRDKGLGPKEMRPPGIAKVTISHTERLEYQRRMANPSGQQAEVVRADIERSRAKGRMAAAKSIASPNHISNKRAEQRMMRKRKEA